MTRMGSTRDSDGTFREPQRSGRPCPECGSMEHFYRVWESNDGAFEDEKHECRSCGKTWWIDGIDA